MDSSPGPAARRRKQLDFHARRGHVQPCAAHVQPRRSRARRSLEHSLSKNTPRVLCGGRVMRRMVPLAGLALVVALLSHFVTVWAAPYFLMSGAMKRISRGGDLVNKWSHPPRTSAKSRT